MSDDGVDFRAMMSDYWTSQWKNVKFPKKGSASTVFDYYLDPKTCGLGVLELQLREDGVTATRFVTRPDAGTTSSRGPRAPTFLVSTTTPRR